MTAAEQVSALIESRVAAVAGKEVETLVGQFAEDVVLFDALGPLSDRGTMTDGTEVSMWVRSTVCCRDTADGWKIVHEHSSVPFSMPGTAAD